MRHVLRTCTCTTQLRVVWQPGRHATVLAARPCLVWTGLACVASLAGCLASWPANLLLRRRELPGWPAGRPACEAQQPVADRDATGPERHGLHDGMDRCQRRGVTCITGCEN